MKLLLALVSLFAATGVFATEETPGQERDGVNLRSNYHQVDSAVAAAEGRELWNDPPSYASCYWWHDNTCPRGGHGWCDQSYHACVNECSGYWDPNGCAPSPPPPSSPSKKHSCYWDDSDRCPKGGHDWCDESEHNCVTACNGWWDPNGCGSSPAYEPRSKPPASPVTESKVKIIDVRLQASNSSNATTTALVCGPFKVDVQCILEDDGEINLKAELIVVPPYNTAVSVLGQDDSESDIFGRYTTPTVISNVFDKTGKSLISSDTTGDFAVKTPEGYFLGREEDSFFGAIRDNSTELSDWGDDVNCVLTGVFHYAEPTAHHPW